MFTDAMRFQKEASAKTTPEEALARVDVGFKAGTAAGGALWNAVTLGFGDLAIQQVTNAVVYNKLRTEIKNRGYTITDISTATEPLWRLDDESGTPQFVNPERTTRGLASRNQTEL